LDKNSNKIYIRRDEKENIKEIREIKEELELIKLIDNLSIKFV